MMTRRQRLQEIQAEIRRPNGIGRLRQLTADLCELMLEQEETEAEPQLRVVASR